MLFIDTEPDQPHWGWSWMDRWMAARPWENRNLDHLKEGPQNIPGLKSLETRTKGVKLDDATMKSPRPLPLASGHSPRVQKSDDISSRSRRRNGMVESVPCPLPSPPSANQIPMVNSDPQLKSPSPGTPEVMQALNDSTPLPPVASQSPAVQEHLEVVPPSPTNYSSRQAQSLSALPVTSEAQVASSNGAASDHDPSCNGLSGSEHGTDEYYEGKRILEGFAPGNQTLGFLSDVH